MGHKSKTLITYILKRKNILKYSIEEKMLKIVYLTICNLKNLCVTNLYDLIILVILIRFIFVPFEISLRGV